jgi:hypothetical protein
LNRPNYVLRLLAVVGLISMMMVGTVATVSASPSPGGEEAEWDGSTNPVLFGSRETDMSGGNPFADGAQEVYFAAVGNTNGSPLGQANTSVTVQNIDIEDAYIFFWVGGEGWTEYAYLAAGASKTFSAEEVGVPEGAIRPVVAVGYNSLVGSDVRLWDPVYLAGVAKQAVAGENLPYTTAADTSVSGYNAVSGREVGFFDQMYFPIVQTNCGPGGCWDTTLRVANVGFDANAAVTVRFFPADDGSGSLQTGFQLQALLDRGELWSIRLSEWVPEGWVGSAHVYTDDAVVAIADRYKVGTDMWITNTASNAVSESDWQFPAGAGLPYVLFAPDVRLDYNGWNTGINVANTVEADTQVSIQYFGNNGNAPSAQTARLAAHGMTYFYNPSSPSEDDCDQPADQVPTCDFVGGAVIISDNPVAAVVDGVKYFGNDANVGQAFSYSATGNVFEIQAAPLVQKGNPATGMGATSGINFMNPNALATFVTVEWINPSGFGADNFGDAIVWVPGYSTGFVYTMFQENLPNGFYGSAWVTSQLPIAATTANVDYQVDGDGTVVWNLYNPCGFFRHTGDCVLPVEPEPTATKIFDTNVAGALICVYPQGIGQDGKPLPAIEACDIRQVFAKGGDAGQGEPDSYGVNLGDGYWAEVLFNDEANTIRINSPIAGFAEIAATITIDPNTQQLVSALDTTCADYPGNSTTIAAGNTGTTIQLNAQTADLFAKNPENFILAINGVCEGQLEAGTVRNESLAEAQERLGALAVVRTDANGDASVELPAGDYYAVVVSDGFETVIETFSLTPGEVEVNEINLEAPGLGTLTKTIDLGGFDAGDPGDEFVLQSEVIFCAVDALPGGTTAGDLETGGLCDSQDDTAAVAHGGYDNLIDTLSFTWDFTADVEEGEYFICSTSTLTGDFDADDTTADESVTTGFICEGPFTVVEGAETVVVNNFVAEAIGSLDVYVESDAAVALTNIEVCVYDIVTGAEVGCQITGATGLVSFDVVAGTYTVAATDANGAGGGNFEDQDATIQYSIVTDSAVGFNGIVDDATTADVQMELATIP